MAYYLQMDGIDDYVKTPSITFTEIILDFTPTSEKTSGSNYFLDSRIGITDSYFYHDYDIEGFGSAWNSVYANDVDVTALNWSKFINVGTRYMVRLVRSTPGTDDVNIFSNNNGTQPTQGRIYSVRFLNGANTVAYYDMNMQNVQDQSGNGNHATLFGGTFVDDGTTTTTTHDGSSSITGNSSSLFVGTTVVNGLTTLSGSSVFSGVGLKLADGVASLTGAGDLYGQSNLLLNGLASLNGSGQLTGIGDMVASNETYDGLAVLRGTGYLVGLSDTQIDIDSSVVDVIKLDAVQHLAIYLEGTQDILINLDGSWHVTVSLEGGLKLKTGQNFLVMSGNSKNIEVTIKDKEGNAVDLTGATVKWLVHSSGTQRVYKDTANGILITDAENGEILISLLSSDTSSLSGEYSHELKIIDSEGKASTVAIGKMNVTKSYLQ